MQVEHDERWEQGKLNMVKQPLANCPGSLLCSLCPAYNICEQCEAGTYAHDPNHVLLKLRRPVPCVAENYSLAEFSPRLPATLEQVR